MILENSSSLGYIFIIAGIAVAFMAYGIYLGLREDKSESEPERIEEKYKPEMEISLEKEELYQPETPLIETPFSLTSEIEPTGEEEVQKGSKTEITKSETTGVDMPQKQELISVVTILREIDSGNLVLRIGEEDYTKLEDLKTSPHLSRIMRLWHDLEQWLKPDSMPKAVTARPVYKSNASDMEPFTARSMVEEINEILERKLREEPGKRKAVKLVEMLDGGVNVYIGVDSYPIDEVPFEDVQQLIRQAVSEWEQRQ